MDMDVEAAAERRRQRILAKGEERMSRVMGTYSGDTGKDATVTPTTPRTEPTHNDPSHQATPLPLEEVDIATEDAAGDTIPQVRDDPVAETSPSATVTSATPDTAPPLQERESTTQDAGIGTDDVVGEAVSMVSNDSAADTAAPATSTLVTPDTSPPLQGIKPLTQEPGIASDDVGGGAIPWDPTDSAVETMKAATETAEVTDKETPVHIESEIAPGATSGEVPDMGHEAPLESEGADDELPGMLLEATHAPVAETATPTEAMPMLSQPYLRKPAQDALCTQEVNRETEHVASTSPPVDAAAGTLHTTPSPRTASVTFPGAVIAASYETQAIRFVFSLLVAVLAVSGQLSGFKVAPVLQLLASNTIITLSAAWVLQRNTSRYKSILQQIRLRTPTSMVESAAAMVAGFVGKWPVEAVLALLGLLWNMYVDSGCYLTAVTALFLWLRSPEEESANP